jgi:hypothetical protein
MFHGAWLHNGRISSHHYALLLVSSTANIATFTVELYTTVGGSHIGSAVQRDATAGHFMNSIEWLLKRANRQGCGEHTASECVISDFEFPVCLHIH